MAGAHKTTESSADFDQTRDFPETEVESAPIRSAVAKSARHRSNAGKAVSRPKRTAHRSEVDSARFQGGR